MRVSVLLTSFFNWKQNIWLSKKQEVIDILIKN